MRREEFIPFPGTITTQQHPQPGLAVIPELPRLAARPAYFILYYGTTNHTQSVWELKIQSSVIPDRSVSLAQLCDCELSVLLMHLFSTLSPAVSHPVIVHLQTGYDTCNSYSLGVEGQAPDGISQIRQGHPVDKDEMRQRRDALSRLNCLATQFLVVPGNILNKRIENSGFRQLCRNCPVPGTYQTRPFHREVAQTASQLHVMIGDCHHHLINRLSALSTETLNTRPEEVQLVVVVAFALIPCA